MELALLLHQEPWRQDLTLLQRWGALDLVDWSGALQLRRQDPKADH